MTTPIITFLSDFGLEDWFVGVAHGVIHELCPEARVVDVTHAVPQGNVAHAAFVIEVAAPDFPPGTVHLAVVDPGVGTPRRPIAVRSRGQLFVGPDNGLLDWALADPAAETHALTDERHFRLPVSRTFHARDVFAPVAAHLARGVPIERLGPTVNDAIRLAREPVGFGKGRVEGRVVFVDRFGNALTDITVASLERAFPGAAEDRLEVEVDARRIHGVVRAYGDAPIGALVAIIGSSNRLEIAEVNGHAASRFGLGVGDRVMVRLGG